MSSFLTLLLMLRKDAHRRPFEHTGKTADFVLRRGDQLLQTLKQRIANESKSQITTLKLWLCKLADLLSHGRL